MSQDQIKKIVNARVELDISYGAKGKPQLSIIIEDLYRHDFPETARESTSVLTTDMDVLRDLFNGGTYIIMGDRMVDYRPSTYTGYSHTEEDLARLQEAIGASVYEKRRYGEAVMGLFEQSRRSQNNGVFLGGEWSAFNLDVKSLGIGGEFKNKLLYRYNPFSPNVVTSLEVERLVCTNGMVASSPFVTFEVPIIGDWKNNLHVVSAQLEPKINDILHTRFEGMAEQRASVDAVMRAHKMLVSRSNQMDLSPEDASRLSQMLELTDVEYQLGRYYKGDVFTDAKRAAHAPSNLTQFDVFNILTEASTHIGRHEEDDAASQRLVNSLVFDQFKNKKKLNPEVPSSQESDHRRFFFGGDK